MEIHPVSQTAVFAPQLHFIESHIGVTQDVRSFTDVGGIFHIAQRNTVIVLLSLALEGAGCGTEGFNLCGCIPGTAVFQDDAEFIPAVSCDDGILREGLFHGTGKLLQYLITDGMTVDVVDKFKIIDIQ